MLKPPTSWSRELRLALGPGEHLHAEGPWASVLGVEPPKQLSELLALMSPTDQGELKRALTREDGSRILTICLSTGQEESPRWFDFNLWSDDGWRLCTIHECTLKRGAVERLIQRGERYRLFIENSGLPYLVHDMEGRLIDANQATLEALGYTREEFCTLHVYDVEMTVKPQSLTGIWNRVPPGQAITLEGCHRRKDGSRFPVEVTLQTAELEGQRLVLALTRDISMRKTADEYQRSLIEQLELARTRADEANSAKSTFLANMSHELRTPLNAVLGYTELLIEETQDNDQAHYTNDLKRIQQASSHLLNIINDILDLSKIEAGKLELSWEQVRIDELLEQCAATLGPISKEHNNQISILVDEELEGFLYADRLKLKQIMLNLLANANKFTRDGDLKLTAKRIIGEGNVPLLHILVEDTGIGIAAEKLPSLFEPFVQADHNTQKLYGGTGLGLSISKMLAQLMGGDITAQSELGRGSRFTVELPLNRVSKDEQTLSPELLSKPQVKQDLGADAPLLLIIDDDVQTHELFRRLMNKEGFRVLGAFDGYQGIAQMRALRPKMVFLDVHLRGKNSMELLKTMRQDATIAHLPVVVISAEDHRDEALEQGAMAFLPKPIERQQLISIVKHHQELQPGTVLVADDDPASREIIQRSVDSIGWKTIEASDGHEALAKLHAERPDVIILDLAMPRLDGFEVISRIRATPGLESLPIIVITGRSFDADTLLELNRKVTEVLRKGDYSVGKLLTLLQRAHRAHQLKRTNLQ